jgi:hypothetical protein
MTFYALSSSSKLMVEARTSFSELRTSRQISRRWPNACVVGGPILHNDNSVHTPARMPFQMAVHKPNPCKPSIAIYISFTIYIYIYIYEVKRERDRIPGLAATNLMTAHPFLGTPMVLTSGGSTKL